MSEVLKALQVLTSIIEKFCANIKLTEWNRLIHLSYCWSNLFFLHFYRISLVLRVFRSV